MLLLTPLCVCLYFPLILLQGELHGMGIASMVAPLLFGDTESAPSTGGGEPMSVDSVGSGALNVSLMSQSSRRAASKLASGPAFHHLLSFCSALLPRVAPHNAVVRARPLRLAPEADAAPEGQSDETMTTRQAENAARIEAIRGNAGAVEEMASALVAPLVGAFGAAVSDQVRYKCLEALSKIVFFSTPDSLRAVLADVHISSFIAKLLVARDADIMSYGMHLAEMLLQLLPDIFCTVFLQEWVLHEVLAIAAPEGGLSRGPPELQRRARAVLAQHFDGITSEDSLAEVRSSTVS